MERDLAALARPRAVHVSFINQGGSKILFVGIGEEEGKYPRMRGGRRDAPVYRGDAGGEDREESAWTLASQESLMKATRLGAFPKIKELPGFGALPIKKIPHSATRGYI